MMQTRGLQRYTAPRCQLASSQPRILRRALEASASHRPSCPCLRCPLASSRLQQRPAPSSSSCESSSRDSSTQPRRQRDVRRACADPKHNPQNVDNPLVLPSAGLSPADAVRVQLDALRCNDEPWTNHGLLTCYEFAEDAGGMEMSLYFGHRKDLYHFDHFMGLFGGRLGSLMNLQSYKVLGEEERSTTTAAAGVTVRARVVDGRGDPAGVFVFSMVQREVGRKKGSWMTKSLVLEEAA